MHLLLTQIPQPDPLALPAPVWLLEVLLLITLVAHMVPMNLLLGGGILAAASHTRAARDPRHGQLTRRLADSLPNIVALTVTLGVAPLLFLQTLYGHLFYTSSILIAPAWLLVILLLMLAYYGAYWMRFQFDDLAGMRPLVAWMIALLLTAIGFIYAHNLALLQRPESWMSHYFQHLTLNWSDAAVYPRYLHTLLAALSVAGVWVAVLGFRRRAGEPEWSEWAMAYGARIFTFATILNLLVGSWYLIALPREALGLFAGGMTLGAMLLLGALVCALLATWLVHRAARSARGGVLVLTGASLLLVAIVFMVIIRQMVRKLTLSAVLDEQTLLVDPQWTLFGIFGLTLLIGLGLLAWIVSVLWRAPPAKS